MPFSISNFGQFLLCTIMILDSSRSSQFKESQSVSVRSYLNLPPDVDRLFNITANFSFYHSINSAFIVRLINQTKIGREIMDQFIFNPGAQSRIQKPITGKYFSVLYCISKSTEKSLEMHLEFNKSAKNLTLIMFYSKDFKENSLDNAPIEVYKSIITCDVSSIVSFNLTIGRSFFDEKAVFPNQLIWINCSASVEHKPIWRPVQIEFSGDINILDIIVNNVTKESSVRAEVGIKNHNSNVICRSLNKTISRKIKIFRNNY